jgi:hypothetical protein
LLLPGGFSGSWLLKEGVLVLQKKEPLHDYKAGALAAVAAVLHHLPVRRNLGANDWTLPVYEGHQSCKQPEA